MIFGNFFEVLEVRLWVLGYKFWFIMGFVLGIGDMIINKINMIFVLFEFDRFVRDIDE